MRGQQHRAGLYQAPPRSLLGVATCFAHALRGTPHRRVGPRDNATVERDTTAVIRRGLRYAEELSDVVQKQLAQAYSAKDLIGWGLRARLREGYRAADFRA